MLSARLEVTDSLGRRLVPIEKPQFAIGRRDSNDLRLAGSEVSRDHAEIVNENNRFLIRDRGSRYGTYVNDSAVTEHALAHGDRIRLGRSGGAEMVFLVDESGPSRERNTTTAVGDLRQIAALLEGLRALGSGRVLDEVLALVLDSAIEVSGAERGFIMLAGEANALEFKLARARGKITLPGSRFETSRKIPEEVFETGQPRIVADLLDGEIANMHMGTVALGIRHVLCVPLRLVRYLDKAESVPNEEKRIGVLYLDSREKGALLSSSTRAALETLATEAAVAIENARLYRETLEKARLEQEMKIAAEIQRALLPQASHVGSFFKAAASSLPCRSIGGDFVDYLELPHGLFGFALGDVAGKGPPAALLSAMLQGIFSAEIFSTDGPAAAVTRVNQALIRRSIENRFVTILYGVLARDGQLTYCNAGHNPPLLVGPRGVRRLQTGGPIVGLFEWATFEQETVQAELGDWLVTFSDGVSEAPNVNGDEFGEERIIEVIDAYKGTDPRELLESLFGRVRDFTAGVPQSDDVTALVLRFEG
jgi:serine phosphatase RsbU (regulator of sigma subunit)/pSer/pThr/pTyr-binding forkhead associated (FHA) protein